MYILNTKATTYNVLLIWSLLLQTEFSLNLHLGANIKICKPTQTVIMLPQHLNI